MSGIVRLGRQMAKVELIAHIERSHSRAASKPIIAHRWTKAALDDFHRIVHIGLGAGADHEHRSPPWIHE
jgi:hypothetical protein